MSDFNPLEDLGSNISDLISNGFPSSSLKVTNETSLGGFNLSTKFKAYKQQQRTRGVISPSYEVKDLNLVVSAKLDTDNTGTLGLEFSDIGKEGSSLNIAVSQGVEDKKVATNLEGDWSYQTDLFGVKLGGTLNVERENPPSFEGTLVLQKPEKFFWSLNGSSEGSDKTFGAGLAYVTDNSEALFSVTHKKTEEDDDKTTYTTNWFQKLSPSLNYGVNFKTSVGGKNQLSSSAVVVGEYKVDSNTTLRAKTTTKSAQTKVYPTLRIGFGLSQRISSGCVVTLGADLNARHLTSSGPEGSPHSLGFEVNLS